MNGRSCKFCIYFYRKLKKDIFFHFFFISFEKYQDGNINDMEMSLTHFLLQIDFEPTNIAAVGKSVTVTP